MAEREDEESTVESSLEELLARKAAEKPIDDDEVDEVLDLDVAADDTLSADALEVKALPQQANEFTCTRCFLVKHQSQIADAKRQVCRDCL